MAELRRHDMARIGQGGRDLLAMARRRGGVEAAGKDQHRHVGGDRGVIVGGHLAARPDPAGAHEIVHQRAAEERLAEQVQVLARDARDVLGADHRQVHADGKVLGDVVGELEVLREQRIEVAAGRGRNAERQQARELGHVKRPE